MLVVNGHLRCFRIILMRRTLLKTTAPRRSQVTAVTASLPLKKAVKEFNAKDVRKHVDRSIQTGREPLTEASEK